MIEQLAEIGDTRRTRIRVGRWVVRCGLRIAYGKREKYREIALKIEEASR